ncbi:nuclease-like protein [Pseudokineococcus lusitanus]|uniref:Nuclease-like protein n=1 Tax=Pseudokineococcus lusitanus TaxID=763993 RepID=A0A3N1GWQ8_9ACTN|nr:nuclease-like protein [Pseudokineococcus lusitanus]
MPTPGRAGASAQREHDRRVAAREARVRARHPRLGGLILALSDEPASTRVWQQGARGERAVAEAVDALGPDVVGLHDRRLRRPDGRLSTPNIDHLVVTPAGVWVVDAKTHTGRLEVRRAGDFLRPRTERLVIRGRDQSRLLDGLATQVAAVTAELERVGADVPVRGALCFVGTELPWGGETVAGVPLVGRRGLTRLLRRPGDMAVEERAAVAAYLAERFPTAG